MSHKATNGQRDEQSMLSEELKQFYASHNVDLSELLQSTNDETPFQYRFVRLNPRFDQVETIKMLNAELSAGQHAVEIPWLDEKWGFFALPASFSLASSQCFRSGRVYGMDVSSGAGVAALLSTKYNKESTEPEKSDRSDVRVLDLCCCPGLKLCMMADFFTDRSATVVGVDVSESRMALCKKIIQKYHVDQETCGPKKSTESVKIQLYRQDGTTFGLDTSDNNLVFDSRAAAEEFAARGKRKRMNKSARARERKRLRQLASEDWVATGDDSEKNTPSIKLFDYVLVDAECSTDGSLKHVKERLKEPSSEQETNAMLTDEGKLAELVELQKKLIASGFRLLREGGIMVYSTCSLSKSQNEDVVEWLLNGFSDAKLVPVHFPAARSKLVVEGSLKGTIRFYPNLGQNESSYYGDGFFLAKLKKGHSTK